MVMKILPHENFSLYGISILVSRIVVYIKKNTVLLSFLDAYSTLHEEDLTQCHVKSNSTKNKDTEVKHGTCIEC
jgi:hypothetical protein